MTWASEFQFLDSCLEVKASGTFDESSYLKFRLSVREVVKKHPARGILIDLQNAILEVPQSGIFSIAASNAELFPAGLPYAVLLSEKTTEPGHAYFGESVAQNHGSSLRAFYDEHEAKQWLRHMIEKTTG